MAFLNLLAPHGEPWRDFLSAPPSTTPDGQVEGAWYEALYAAVVFEHCNPGWEDMPGMDQGPAGQVIDLLNERGWGAHQEALDDAERRAHEQVDAVVSGASGPLAFLELHARNGQPWREYLRKCEPHRNGRGWVDGAWGECLTSAIVFEHQNPQWSTMEAFKEDGPAGQVLMYLNDLGHEPFAEGMDQLESATHDALNDGRRIPVFNVADYQPPVGLEDAPVGAPVEPTGRKKGLCIACNYPGQKGELRGCINDSAKWRQLLLNYGFSPSDILVLHDERGRSEGLQSFRSRCVDAMRWLVDGARSGDVLFFTFSGHGSQVPNKDGTEEDGMDEVILPTDFRSEGVIKDDELFDLLVGRLPAGVRMTVVLDCCHSGSALDLPYVWGGPQGPDEWQMEPDPVHSRGDVQMFSGCEDDQCSSDVTVAGVSGGAMTNALTSVLEQYGSEVPEYPELMHRLHDELARKRYKQKPRLSSSQPFDAHKPFSLSAAAVPNQNAQVGFPSAKCRLKPPRPLGFMF